jgi:hypothetical protein
MIRAVGTMPDESAQERLCDFTASVNVSLARVGD